MTLRDQLAAMPPGSLIPRDWLLEQLDVEPEAREPELVQEPESWRTRIWTCPAETRLGVAELGEALGRASSWVYRRTSTAAAKANGRHAELDMLPHRRLSGELVFQAGEIRDWLRRHEVIEVPGVDERFRGAQAGGRR